MKKIIISLLLCFTYFILYAQDNPIRLSKCIHLAMENKSNIQAVKIDVLVANLQELEAKNKYLPQISLVYEYRYNPIIASQIIPMGQLSASANDEMRVVQFGTNWQQTAGIDLKQSLLDFSIQSKIAESKINEKIKQADLQIAEEEITYEVLKTFSNLLSYTLQLESAVIDTARTFRSYQLINNQFEAKRVLKTDVNKAFLNHNNAIASYKTAISDLVKEKIYLSFLTAMPLEKVMNGEFDFTPLASEYLSNSEDVFYLDKVASVQQLKLKGEQLKQQVKSERNKYLPTFNLIGYLGANQFADKFNPTMPNSWFGNSYLGVSIKMPLFGENVKNKVRQLQTQIEGANHNSAEIQNKMLMDYLQASEDILKHTEQINLAEDNVNLMCENVIIFQERFAAGQYNASELNLQELDLLKEKNNLLKLQANLILKQIDQLNFSGMLNIFVEGLD